jgi:glycosyltransferase involved in cell wall biosynthesis
MKVMFVAASLGCGGAERNVAVLAREMHRYGHSVSVTTFSSLPDFYALPDAVSRIRLETERPTRHVLEALTHNLAKVGQLRGLLRATRPDVVVASVDRVNVVALLAAAFERTPVVCTEVALDTPARGRLWRLLTRCLYPRASALVCASQAVSEQFSFVSSARRLVIGSALDLPAAGVPEQSRENVLLYVGRLHPVKNLPLLFRAFSIASRQAPAWSLRLVGDGPMKTQLQALATELGIAPNVEFAGLQRDVTPHYRQAAITVLSSNEEGFGNVLVEAQHQGCAVVSTACGGPQDVIAHGQTGLLVPVGDAPALAGVLAELMTNRELRERLARQGQSAAARFDTSRIVRNWEQLLSAVASRGPAKRA